MNRSTNQHFVIEETQKWRDISPTDNERNAHSTRNEIIHFPLHVSQEHETVWEIAWSHEHSRAGICDLAETSQRVVWQCGSKAKNTQAIGPSNVTSWHYLKTITKVVHRHLAIRMSAQTLCHWKIRNFQCPSARTWLINMWHSSGQWTSVRQSVILWLQRCGFNSRQGTCLGCRSDPRSGCYGRPLVDISLSQWCFSLSNPFSLSIPFSLKAI